MSSKSVSTAFQKMHVTKKDISFFASLKSYVSVGFRWAIPEAVADMPPRGMYFVGILANVFALIIFCMLTLGTYDSDVHTEFLSPSEKSGYCEEVLRPVTSTVLADTRGFWQSSSFFDSSRAIYQFHFQNLTASNQYWAQMIDALEATLVALGGQMQDQTLDVNLLYWTTFVGIVNIGTAMQYFNFYSDVGIIFNREYVQGVVAGVDSDCNATSSSQFDVGSFELSTTYSFADFMANPRCSSVLDPFHLGYNPMFDGDSFVLSYDVRSLVTALAVNAKIVNYQTLRPIVGENWEYFYNNITYTSALFYNTRFPGMDPIACLVDRTHLNNVTRSTNVTCLFQFKNGSYALPLLNSGGYSPEFPSYCACDDSAGGAGPGRLDINCDNFNLLSGYLIFNFGYASDDYLARNPFIDMLAKVPQAQVSKYAYEAMFVATSSAMGAYYMPEYADNQTYRDQLYSFCNVGYAVCSLVVINTFDSKNMAVSDLFYELFNGSCADSVTIPAASMDRLAAVPPELLVEPYYNCRKSRSTILSNAVGIAVGNVHALLPILFLLVAQVYLVLLYWEGKPPVQTYVKEEREDALKALALQLLMMRDNRLPPRRSGSLYKAYPHVHGDASLRRQERPGRASGAGRRALPGAGSTSVLRLLTDELMENAYVNVYFSADGPVQGGRRRPPAVVHARTPGSAGGSREAGEVEMATMPATATAAAAEQLQAVAVLNPLIDESLDTIVAFGTPASGTAAARSMIGTIDALVNRILASMMTGAQEDFWTVAEHTAVLHRIDLEELRRRAFESAEPEELRVYVRLVMKIYQLLHMHVRISHGCTAQEAHALDAKAGYRVGDRSQAYCLAELETMYNKALVHAMRHKVDVSHHHLGVDLVDPEARDSEARVGAGVEGCHTNTEPSRD